MNIFKVWGVHIAAIIVGVVLVFTTVSFILNSYTRHGEALEVPDIRGMHILQAEAILSEKKLRLVIMDSLFFADKPKLSVLEQNPAAGAKVKEGRTIYLTINADAAPMVAVPDLIDVSLRQAATMLSSLGLKEGKLIYKPDIARDVVLEQMYQGKPIHAGVKIAKGSAIDLVLGEGTDGGETTVPDLEGLSLDEATGLIQSSSLNIGSIIFHPSVTDSLSAKVYKQNPAYAQDLSVKSGTPIDIYLK